ncbi:MAG TPA: D-alanyl-D-alanine carboxypeptidase/D-alanyl-D-alanine-endopeptidase [Aquella sp.]|nr:D-alanyl-D-alanine carboxypeptidase/D-alanyl-D-alanine-endopeptidase [Aquella sp.]
MKKKFLACWLFFNASFGLNITIPNSLKSNLSVDIIDADTAEPIYNYNAATPRLIASNVKLFTTIFGLTYLGPDFHWHTQLKHSGNIREHTLYGNVYIQGGGDPTLDSPAIYEIIAHLKHMGITTINGDVILDSSLFNDKPTYSMLQTNQYDVDKIPPSGLIINGNRANFTIHVNGHNVSISHNLYNIKVLNLLKLDPDSTSCDMDDTVSISFHDNLATLNGSVSPLCDNLSTSFTLLSNFNYNKMVLTQIFKDFNININGDFKNDSTPKTARLIYDHGSQSLAHIIYDMNKTSNNLYAETIISTVGAYKASDLYRDKLELQGNDEQRRLQIVGKERNHAPVVSNHSGVQAFSDGAKLYYKFLQNNNLLNTKFKLENGAGLSRYEFFTAEEVAHLLYNVNNSPIIGPILEASLPVAAGEGSLQKKFTDFSGRFMAKTGTLNDTRAYSGYFYSKSGSKYIVVFIADNLTNQEQKLHTQSFIEQILEQLN